MRWFSRLVLAAALIAPPAVVAVSSCSTGAVGAAACTTIEEARCQLAPLCTPDFDVARCQRFYRDGCLNGIQNTTLTMDPNPLAAGCVSALQAAAACVDGGGGASACPGVTLVANATCGGTVATDPTACALILDCPEVLTACNFVAQPPDAGADAAASDDGAATADAAEMADSGDAASD